MFGANLLWSLSGLKVTSNVLFNSSLWVILLKIFILIFL